MRLAIIGSRSCTSIDIESHVPVRPDMIISGGAIGADSLAKRYAVANSIPMKEFLPEYGKYGRKAPILRNIQIVQNCEWLLAFWDGKSRGTKFTIDYALKHGVVVKVVYIQ